jgi:hypothetical protein
VDAEGALVPEADEGAWSWHPDVGVKPVEEPLSATVRKGPLTGEHAVVTIAWGMPGVFRCDLTNACAIHPYPTAHAAAGASGARHSLRPLIGEGGNFRQTSSKTCCEIAKPCLSTEAVSEYKRATFSAVIARP